MVQQAVQHRGNASDLGKDLRIRIMHNECATASIRGNRNARDTKLPNWLGTSPTSLAEATKAAIAEASKTVRHMDWFEVVRESGRIVDGKVEEFQVTLKVGFKIER
jgi:dodecin